MDEQIELTEDAFLGGQITLLQPKTGYRAGIDPVLLAAAVKANEEETVLDIGTGVGTAAMCLLKRVPGIHVTGLEVQGALLPLANQNAERNGLVDRFTLVEGDVRCLPTLLKEQSFDHVMTNPPYYQQSRGQRAPNELKAKSNMGSDDLMEVWLDLSIKRLKPGGRLTLIHRAESLGDILSYISSRLGDLCIFPIWPSNDKPANRVVISGVKESRAPLRLARGLIMHEPGARYCQAAEKVLRHGEALRLI